MSKQACPSERRGRGRCIGSRLVFCLALWPVLWLALAILVVGPSGALQAVPAQPMPIDLSLPVDVPARDPVSGGVRADVVIAVIDWLADETGLPRTDALPDFRFIDADRMAELVAGGDTAMPRRTDLVALYDASEGVVYLPLAWSGDTPAEMSVLVHELVHHLQGAAGIGYPCAQAREKSAYAAQKAWLAAFGHDFYADFDVDPMALLVRTNCGF